MNYDFLHKYYYKDKVLYEKKYAERIEAGIDLGISINRYPAFFIENVEIYKNLLDIQRTNEKITALAGKLPPIALRQYTNRSLIDEIILTNDIEGVQSTRKEIGEVLADLEKNNNKNRFFGLVNKYSLLTSGQDLILKTSSDVRSLYDELFSLEIQSEDPGDVPDGEIFRKGTVTVVSSTQKIVHYGIMPESSIIDAMDKALNVLNNSDIEIIIRTALFHYLFGYIHPFYEGNGRMSRFISSYMLTKVLHPLAGYRLSYEIKENLTNYYRAFQNCNDERNRGDLTSFVIMFTEVVNKECLRIYDDLLQRYETLIELNKITTKIAEDQQIADLYYVLIQASLFSESGITTQELLDCSKISRPTLIKRLMSIQEKNLLQISKVGKRKHYSLNLDALIEYDN